MAATEAQQWKLLASLAAGTAVAAVLVGLTARKLGELSGASCECALQGVTSSCSVRTVPCH